MKHGSPEGKNELTVAAPSASTFVAELIAGCRAGEFLDAQAVLAEHPELLDHKSALLELAYEDFCRRDDLGNPVEPGEFAAQFPTISRSLLHQIEVHRLLADGPASGASPVPAWPMPGQTWLDFQLLEELGRGAYSRVYLAREKSLGDRLVVVKATSLGSQEAHTLGMLQHPQIVPVHSMQRDEQRGLTAVCMPFLSRVSLFDVMDVLFSSPQPPTRAAAILEAVRRLNALGGAAPDAAAETIWPRGWSYAEAVLSIGIQIAQALQHAHRQGVLHGDVKPSNILITNSGRAVLLDFNLAIFGDESGHLIAGTLPYMAPEQLRPLADRGAPRDEVFDERADVFSLGLTLYELLNGRPPFGPLPAENSRDRLASRLLERYREGPEKATGPSAHVDRSIHEIIERCLEFDPGRRPQSMDELQALFRAQLKSGTRIRRRLRRHRLLTVGSATLACAGLLALGGWLASRDPYPIREWRNGEVAYQHQDYRGAVRHLTEALEYDPGMNEARFLRAIARFRAQDLGGAYDDLVLLCKESSDGRPRAALAHVLVAREEKYSVASAHYRQAVQEGCRSPVIYNNLGYCLLLQGSLQEAADALKTACTLDPQMGMAYHNLGRVEMRSAVRARHIADPAPMEEALRLGPKTSQLYLETAFLYAIRARSTKDDGDRARSIDRVFELLREGLSCGLTSKNLDEVAALNPKLRGDDRWRALAVEPHPTVPFTRAVLMVDPLSELVSPQARQVPAVARR